MEKFLELGEKFGLQGEKLLEFVREQEEKEERLRKEQEEKEERLRKEQEEKEERLRKEQEEKEERRRLFEEEKEERLWREQEERRKLDEEREARWEERELRKLEMEADILRQKEAAEAAKREHELELARLGQGRNVFDTSDKPKAPKLPSFVDGKDDLDAYLQRFGRFASVAKWDKTGWASKLSALLSGRALEVYSRISEEAAQDYDHVRLALMKRYDLTEDGYRCKFRAFKPEVEESPDQFIVRLEMYLLRWLD